MKPQKYVILDRDGTIIVKHHYLSDPDQVELIPKAAKALKLLKKLEFGLIVITNQSAIGRGFINTTQLDLIHNRMYKLLALGDVMLNGLYFCPHLPEDNCVCRKPQPGLLYQAARDYQFDLADCFIVGDNYCDIELGQKVGATTFLVRTGEGSKVESEEKITPNYIVDSLWDVACMIKKTTNETLKPL